MVEHSHQTPNKYIIDITSSEQRAYLDLAPAILDKYHGMLKEKPQMLEDGECQANIIEFLVKAIGKIDSLVTINVDNPALGMNHRCLLSDLYRVACDEQPHISFSLRLNMIRDENDLNMKGKNNSAGVFIHDNLDIKNIDAVESWTNIFQNVNLVDILCVTKEILGNHD